MDKIRLVLRQGFSAITIILMMGMAPAPALALDSTTDTNTTQAPTATQTPSNGPTGAGAATFQYNTGTGLWENDYYTYNPSTKETVPKTPLEYTYNPDTGMWDTKMWVYSDKKGAYSQVPMSVSTPPAGAVTHGGPTDTTGSGSSGAVSQSESQAPAATDNTPPSATAATDSSAPSATPATGGSTPASSSDEVVPAKQSVATPLTQPSSGTALNTTTSPTLNNTVTVGSQSGNSQALGNDDVAGVATGDATAIANIVNMLQSQASFTGSGLATFTTNIQGNVTGDLVIDPATLTQPAGADPQSLANATINNQTNGAINNDINLSALTGNATANNNDDVGNITTGNANAVADVINMINSVVAANQSFVGVINIYGDYVGNILMPADSLNALLASGSPSTTAGGASTVNNSTTSSVANNVNLAAASGNTTVTGNDSVGSAASGNALTNLTILNLTGHQVVAANSLLVFVNVLGNWVGLIMDAPAGATSAALGGGVTSDAVLAAAANATNNSNYGITNNINVAAGSGNATAKNNDDIGSISTGNATASANIANLINSSFGLSNWFGVLFINVFGTWHGNFGVVQKPVVAPITSGSALPSTVGSAGGSGGGGTPGTVGNIFKGAKVFAFVPKSHSNSNSSSHSSNSNAATQNLQLTPVNMTDDNQNGGSGSNTSTPASKAAAMFLGSSDTNSSNDGSRGSGPQNPAASFNYASLMLITLGSAGLGIIAVERIRNSLRSRYISSPKV